MKEFIDKLIERLEEYKIKKSDDSPYGIGVLNGYAEAISIVNELAEEYKGGWVPCCSGYFSTSEVLVCKEDGTIDFDVYDFMDNDWKFNSNHHKNKVVAWQPLPAPYTEGE